MYAGIDLIHHGAQGKLEYDFVIAPGADPAQIVLAISGAAATFVDSAGSLVLDTPLGAVRHLAPVAYQARAGKRELVPARYRVTPAAAGGESFEVRFEVGPYDTSRVLTIDPVLDFSTYVGGTGLDHGNAIAVDGDGYIYIAGYTSSPELPSAAPMQGARSGGSDLFVLKLTPAGDAIVYATYLGGSGDDDVNGPGGTLAVDDEGSVYVTGKTTSLDFPMVGAIQSAHAGRTDVVVAKLSADGSQLLYSTYLGGTDHDYNGGIAIDAAGGAYTTGYTASFNFPIVRPIQPTHHEGFYDAFVARLRPDGSALVYSTYLGGGGEEYGFGIAVDGDGNAYVTGITGSGNFPLASPLQPAHGGQYDAYVTKLSADGATLLYSTFLGGNGYDFGLAITLDAQRSAYVTGIAVSDNFPTVNAAQPSHGSYELWRDDAFISKLNPGGTALVYSTYLGGKGGDFGYGIAVDGDGNAYIAGGTFSPDFPTVDPLQPTLAGVHDIMVAKLNPTGSAFLWATYLGGTGDEYALGLAIDASGASYVVGTTSSGDFPVVNALQSLYAGSPGDAFIARLRDVVPSPCDRVESIIATIESSTLSAGTKTSLLAKLAAACAAFERGNPATAIRQLTAFQNEVHAQSGSAISAAFASELIQAAQAVIDEV